MTDRRIGPLSWPLRVALWDAVLGAVRSCLRRRGLLEVTTPVRVRAPAIEPYIEPIAAPPGYLATSPELSMKRLLCRGAGSMFQVSHVFRRAERGRLHSEEFHLVEWYRVDAAEDAVVSDVEALVEAVFDAAARVLPSSATPVARWETRGILELVEATTGLTLRGDEDAGELRGRVASVDASLCPEAVDDVAGPGDIDPDVATLEAWTSFFSQWSDRHLDPWLEQRDRQVGLHVVEFPVALAALSELAPAQRTKSTATLARRFESHVGGVELANGYLELRDADEQRRRFEIVSGLRAALDLPVLPLDEDFLSELRSPGLPRCAGCALGLDRLIMLAANAARLADVSTLVGGPFRE